MQKGKEVAMLDTGQLPEPPAWKVLPLNLQVDGPWTSVCSQCPKENPSGSSRRWWHQVVSFF